MVTYGRFLEQLALDEHFVLHEASGIDPSPVTHCTGARPPADCDLGMQPPTVPVV